MAIHLALNHVTSYQYDRRVGLSPQLVRLRPAPHCRTPILSYSLRIAPEPHFVNWQQDPQSNHVNSYEAESRRLARFVPRGHTPGRLAAPRPEQSREFPCTLDLRT